MNAQELRNANTNAQNNEQMTINLDSNFKIIDGKVMEKQKKVISRIARANEGAKGVKQKIDPNDECYTDYHDIVAELTHWGELGKLRGKNIICPCDWDITKDSDVYRIRVEFNTDAVSQDWDTVIDKITTTTVQRAVWTDTDLGKEEIADLLYDKLKCNFVGVLIDNAQEWGVKSITASGYNPELDKGFKFQDVDYSQYDVCITNPPFSLYGEFMKCIVGKIDFCILAPFKNRNCPVIGLPIQLNQAYLGYGRCLSLNFVNPTAENNYQTKKVACDWLVSWPDAQEEVNSINYKTGVNYELYADLFEECENITMKDGTHPIRVSAAMLPEDYEGWMFADMGVLTKLNTNLYEFYGTNFKGYYNKVNVEANPFAHKASDHMLEHNGKHLFHGFIIRKKQH